MRDGIQELRTAFDAFCLQINVLFVIDLFLITLLFKNNSIIDSGQAQICAINSILLSCLRFLYKAGVFRNSIHNINLIIK